MSTPPDRPSAQPQLPPAQVPAQPQLEVDSGTGWPADPTPSVPAPRSAEAPPRRDDRPRRPGFIGRRVSKWGRRGFWLASLAGVIVVLLLLITVLGRWPDLTSPFKTRTIDRSQPVLLLSIQDLARFEAASGNFQVVVDIQKDKSFIPDIIFSQRSLFVAAGSVNAYVDFTNLGDNDVVTSVDRKTATINLPAPQLDKPTLDLSRSYVYSEQSGLVNKIGDLFGGDSDKQQELYLYAEQKIAAAAVDSQLADRAETNTRAMLTELLHSLGFVTITINFADA